MTLEQARAVVGQHWLRGQPRLSGSERASLQEALWVIQAYRQHPSRPLAVYSRRLGREIAKMLRLAAILDFLEALLRKSMPGGL